MGWFALILVAVTSFGLALAFRFPRGLWMFLAAALALGAAGYAWQGRPGQPASPVSAEAQRRPVDPEFKGLRQSLFGRFAPSDGYFAVSDAMLNAGKPRVAANALIGAIKKRPEDPALWAGLGLVLVEADSNTMSPAAKLAFERAVRLDPRGAGPAFFYGLGHIRSGAFAQARPWWARALALSPANAPYRRPIAERLAVLDQFLIIQAQIEAGNAAGGDRPPPVPRPQAAPAQPAPLQPARP